MSMRVTQNSNFRVMQDSLHRSKSRLEDLQYKASTLKKLNKPSDDPIASAKLLELRTQKETNNQYSENAKMIEAFLGNSEHGLGELGEIVLRAKEIAIGMANGNNAQSNSRLGVAEEVDQLLAQAIATANRRVGDRYLFGGYKTDNPPVSAEGVYQGDDGEMMAEIANDVYLAMNMPGFKAFNTVPDNSRDRAILVRREREMAEETGYSELAEERRKEEIEIETRVQEGQNINLFDELNNLKRSLLTGDVEGVRDTLDRFDTLHNKLVSARAQVGSRMSGLESAIRSLDRQNLTAANLNSQLEDADMAKVMSDMAKEETVFRSTLQSSTRLVQPTLMDFLR